jgi:hypothetical protein
MSAAKGAELQEKISSEIKGTGFGMFQLGMPSLPMKHGQVEPTQIQWLRVGQL